jgi:hypothetical protein
VTFDYSPIAIGDVGGATEAVMVVVDGAAVVADEDFVNDRAVDVLGVEIVAGIALLDQ